MLFCMGTSRKQLTRQQHQVDRQETWQSHIMTRRQAASQSENKTSASYQSRAVPHTALSFTSCNLHRKTTIFKFVFSFLPRAQFFTVVAFCSTDDKLCVRTKISPFFHFFLLSSSLSLSLSLSPFLSFFSLSFSFFLKYFIFWILKEETSFLLMVQSAQLCFPMSAISWKLFLSQNAGYGYNFLESFWLVRKKIS